jgi:hypothetical protein
VKHKNVAAISFDKAIFRAAAKPDYSGPDEPLTQVHRQSPPQVRPPRLDPRDAAILKDMCKPAHGRLDFG